MSIFAGLANSRASGDVRRQSGADRDDGRSENSGVRSKGEWRRDSRASRLLVSLAVLVAGAVFILPLGDLVASIDYHEMTVALRRMPAGAIAASIAATVLSFAALVGRDASALRYIGARTSFSALLLASFCGTALGNAAGFGALTAAAVRYRIYGAVGIKRNDVTRLILFVMGGFALGLAGIGGLAGLIEADPVAALLGWAPSVLRVVAAAAVASSAYLLVFGLRGPIRIGGFSLVPPSKPLAASQLALTSIRLLAAAIALWVLLPPIPIGFAAFAAIFSAATALAVVSHVPGGVGVFELVVLWALRGHAHSDAVAAALLAYRGIYYVLPLVISAGLFAFFEVRLAVAPQSANADERLSRVAARLSPTFIGVLVFVAGIMLLVSGATPTFGQRLSLLSSHLPLWAVETSHFLGSLIGVLFLFVARGLLDRRDGAWRLAFALTIASLGFSVVKGLAFGEAGFLSILAMLMLATRPQFYRPTSMLDQPFTLGWFAAVGLVIAAAFGILFLAFHNLGSAVRDLWWQFAFDAQAPRALRALLGASVVAFGFGVAQLLRPPKGLASLPSRADLTRAATIVAKQDRSDALLALMGDKSFLFSPSGLTFLMFGKRGRSWIALLDPVGPTHEWPSLITRFIEQAHAHGGRAAFYQVRPESLPFYLDAGFSVMKLGEDARIPLRTFSLQGGAASHLRYALRRGEREGLTFEYVGPDASAACREEIGAISREWLEARAGDEKGFSVAAFEPRFLAAQGLGLVRANGKLVAFASVMTTSTKVEASIGMMRSSREASAYAMEFLFTRLFVTLREQNFGVLSLGVAPLSGLRTEPLCSRWHWLGAQIWKHGDRFYNFKGLRTFKSKFNPVWEPRYLAASGTLGPFVALADAAALIAAGLPSSTSERDHA
ncbi:MAG: bifunctional lysylphosphatidylglycerol flippase/synthetase MprF [Roseiarcus sp.]